MKLGSSDSDVRAHVLREWQKIDAKDVTRPGQAAHCGGRGLAVGCPVCGKRPS